MAWTTPRTWITSEVVTASVMNTHVRDNFNETGPAVATTAGRYLVVNAANDLVERNWDRGLISTSENTTSTSYTDLTTTGPTVSSLSSTSNVIVVVTATTNNSGGSNNYMSFAISGDATLAADDSRALLVSSTSIQASSAVFTVTGVTGSCTYTAKYRVSGGTGTWSNRYIVVVPF